MKRISVLLSLVFAAILMSACENLSSDKNEGRFDTNDYYMFAMQAEWDQTEAYFGIGDTKTVIFTSQADFDTFENKVKTAGDNTDETRYVSRYEFFSKSVDFNTQKVAVTAMYNPHTSTEFNITSIVINNNSIDQTFTYEVNIPSVAQSSFGFFYLVLDKNESKEIKSEFITHNNYDPYVCYKPVVYFYPEEEIDLSIYYINKDRLLTTYPKYEDGWNIHLNKDGTFTSNNRTYYALYFDELANYTASFNEGFYVTKDNAISFLEEKLDLIGYTEREANEFIMYWLPVLEENEQSLVYFEQSEIRNQECPLEFSIDPDTLIRNIIHIKKVDRPVVITEQKLTSYSRRGFSVVEWGGVKY